MLVLRLSVYILILLKLLILSTMIYYFISDKIIEFEVLLISGLKVTFAADSSKSYTVVNNVSSCLRVLHWDHCCFCRI